MEGATKRSWVLLTEIPASPAGQKSRFALEQAAQLLFLQAAGCCFSSLFTHRSLQPPSRFSCERRYPGRYPVEWEQLQRRRCVCVVLLPGKAWGFALPFSRDCCCRKSTFRTPGVETRHGEARPRQGRAICPSLPPRWSYLGVTAEIRVPPGIFLLCSQQCSPTK